MPCATEPGEYTIYYKVAGDANHVDSQAQAVTSTIAAKDNRAGGSNPAKTGDTMSYAVPAATALVALASAALAFAACRRARTRD